MTFRTLDVFFYRGHKLVSLGVRLLTSIRYGIPFRDALSHCDIRYNDTLNISAESSGTKLIPIENALAHNDIEVYRFRHLPPLDEFYKVANQLLGRPYAYARYVLDAARIFSFCFMITGLVLSLFSWRIKIGIFAVVGLLQLVSIWFRTVDAQTYDCAENVAVILDELSLMPTLPKARNEFPNSLKSKMDMLCQYGQADLIAEWNHDKKKWECAF